jgi:hypothetical protein
LFACTIAPDRPRNPGILVVLNIFRKHSAARSLSCCAASPKRANNWREDLTLRIERTSARAMPTAAGAVSRMGRRAPASCQRRPASSRSTESVEIDLLPFCRTTNRRMSPLCHACLKSWRPLLAKALTSLLPRRRRFRLPLAHRRATRCPCRKGGPAS